MTWKNLGYQPHPWRAATGCMAAAVKAGEGQTSTWGLGCTAAPFPTLIYAGRLRLVLECEEHGGRDQMLASRMVHTLPWANGPLHRIPCFSLPTQYPGPGYRIPLEKQCPGEPALKSGA